MKTFLVIQTAFIGDAILASPVIEKLHLFYPDAQIDLLIRKGNEGLFKNHPRLNHLFVWDKSSKKYNNLLRVFRELRKTRYNHIINLQRFATTGLLTCLLRADEKVGFKKNPFSFCYHQKLPHKIEKGVHEVDRNLSLTRHLTDSKRMTPKLYPTPKNEARVAHLKSKPFVCIAPTSVWFTKQAPEKLWKDLVLHLPDEWNIYLLGGPGDAKACAEIRASANRDSVENLAGKLNLLESAALMKDAAMNYVNDSAPLHLASAVNAPVTAVFCSTVPDFGFGPLSENSRIVEIETPLYCRPCGLHGFKTCPEGHFKCGNNITVNQMLINQ